MTPTEHIFLVGKFCKTKRNVQEPSRREKVEAEELLHLKVAGNSFILIFMRCNQHLFLAYPY